MEKIIPVYLFLGFLDSGKTRFMHENLCDREFMTGEKTLVVLCEEGEEELDTSKYTGGRNVTIVTVEDKDELTEDFLSKAAKKARAERVMIEYNGMWLLSDLAQVLPKNWQIFHRKSVKIWQPAGMRSQRTSIPALRIFPMRPAILMGQFIFPGTVSFLTVRQSCRMKGSSCWTRFLIDISVRSGHMMILQESRSGSMHGVILSNTDGPLPYREQRS